jgi:agmatinase
MRNTRERAPADARAGNGGEMADSDQGDAAFTRESLYGTAEEPTYSGALSFMRRRYTRDLTGADVAVTGIPLDIATSNRPGTRFGPAGIRAASAQIAWGPAYPWDFDPFSRLAVIDYGDCVWDHARSSEIPEAIQAHARKILEAGTSLVSLGGDHYISLPLLRAHAAVHGPLALVHFDAHSDTWSQEDETNRVDHGTMFYQAAQEGIVVPDRSVQVGIRTANPDRRGFHWLDANWVHDNGVAATCAEIRRIVGDHKAYLTFDIDCLDPAFAPGTGTPVCGGLSTAQALGILRDLASVDFVGMDLVEVAPAYDSAEVTSLAAATLVWEYLCLRASKLPERSGDYYSYGSGYGYESDDEPLPSSERGARVSDLQTSIETQATI